MWRNGNDSADALNDLLSRISEMKRKFENMTRVLARRGDEFNVFALCGVDHYETVHSRILAELLSPKGSHGQKGAFLIEFCRLFKIPMFSEKAIVTTEVTAKVRGVEGRRFDILIEDGESICIIENKIFAGEQPEQLKSYSEWLKGITKKNKTLIFLTPNGREGVSAVDSASYKAVAYLKDGGNDICDWLELCRRVAIDAPFVRESISQYINHIKNIIHGGAIMNDEVSNLLGENMEAAQLAYDNYAITAVRKANEIMKKIAEALGPDWTVSSAFDFKRRESGALFSRSTDPDEEGRAQIYVLFGETNFWNCQVALWSEDKSNPLVTGADGLGNGWNMPKTGNWKAWKAIKVEEGDAENGMVWDGRFFDRFEADPRYRDKVISEIKESIETLANKIR